jgi:hypothetical protein
VALLEIEAAEVFPVTSLLLGFAGAIVVTIVKEGVKEWFRGILLLSSEMIYELSPDLFFWDFFLRTGRADAYRLAHDQARHGGDVDSYHLGNFTGLGTRHGVQHWSDSAKQARIATPVYRKTFYYISGGDERTGDLVREILDVDKAFLLVDARRKVRDPSVVYKSDAEALYLNFGTDWAGIAQAYLIEWERRGPRWEDSREKLVEALKTYPKLKNGFVTGEALYNSLTGAWAPPPTDPSNNGSITVSHLSGVFGVLETIVSSTTSTMCFKQTLTPQPLSPFTTASRMPSTFHRNT